MARTRRALRDKLGTSLTAYRRADARASPPPSGDRVDPLHRLRGRRALAALLHRGARRRDRARRRAGDRRARQRLDRHQRRRRPDGGQADRDPRGAVGARPRVELPQHPRRRHTRRVRGVERTRCDVPDAPDRPWFGDPVLPARPRRTPHRGRPDDRRVRNAMRYMLQVYFNGAQARLEQLPDADRDAIVREYVAFFQTPEVKDGNQLQPAATATTVRVLEGETVLT